MLVHELRALGMNVNLRSETEEVVDFDKLIESEENMEDASIPEEDLITEIQNGNENAERSKKSSRNTGTASSGESVMEEMQESRRTHRRSCIRRTLDFSFFLSQVMQNINKVILIGNVARAPDIRTTAGGQKWQHSSSPPIEHGMTPKGTNKVRQNFTTCFRGENFRNL